MSSGTLKMVEGNEVDSNAVNEELNNSGFDNDFKVSMT